MKLMTVVSTASIALGTLTLPACQSPGADNQRLNQFESLPKSATTPPQISDFLTPYQNIVQKSEAALKQNEQQTEQSLSASEQKLQRSLQQGKSKPGT